METAYERLLVLKEKGLSLEEVMELDPAADIFPSSPFDAGTGYKASQLFADRAYTSMLK